jgi:hypothetical protein
MPPVGCFLEGGSRQFGASLNKVALCQGHPSARRWAGQDSPQPIFEVLWRAEFLADGAALPTHQTSKKNLE